MIKLKTEVNKSAVMRELQEKAIESFKDSWQPELRLQAYMNGLHDLFKLLRIDDVSNMVCEHPNKEKRWGQKGEKMEGYWCPDCYTGC